jgi:type I restriction enzyme S subunit
MQGWTKYKLEELGEFKNGINYSADKAGTGIPVINVKDITDFHFINQHQLAIVDFPIKPNSNIVSKKGDIFFVRSSVKREGSGEVAILKEENTSNTVHCGFVIRFRLIKEVDSIFFLYLFKSDFKRDQVRNLASGATIYNISQDALKSIEIYLPPLLSQQRIASILSAYDELIEVNNQRIKLFEETASQLYKEWFVRMRFPGYKKTKFIKGIPEGWEVKKVDEVADATSSKEYFYLIMSMKAFHFIEGKRFL